MNPRSPVTLSNENGRSRPRLALESRPATNVAHWPAHALGRPTLPRTGHRLLTLGERRP
jgi:hypothetical protein